MITWFKFTFAVWNNLCRTSTFTPLMCFLLSLWINECNTLLLNPCIQHIHDTRLCTRLTKLLTSPLFFSTYTACCNICYGVLYYRGRILLFLLRRIAGASQGLSTISQALLTTLPNHNPQPFHL